MDVTQDLVNEISYLVSSTDWNAIGKELVGYVEDFFNSYGISGADLAPIGMLALMVFMVIAALVACVAVCAIVAAVFTLLHLWFRPLYFSFRNTCFRRLHFLKWQRRQAISIRGLRSFLLHRRTWNLFFRGENSRFFL